MSKAKEAVAKMKERYLKGIRFFNHAYNTNENSEDYRRNYEKIDWSKKDGGKY